MQCLLDTAILHHEKLRRYWKSFLKHARSDKGKLHTFGWRLQANDLDEAQAHVVIRLLYILRTSETDLGYRLFHRSDTTEVDEKAILHLRGWDRFYAWNTFGDAIALGSKSHPFPLVWRTARLPLKRRLRPPLTAPDSPVEELPDSERLQPEQMFDDRILSLDREGRSINFAHSLIGSATDMRALPAHEVKYRWLGDEYEFRFLDRRMEDLYQWVVSKKQEAALKKQATFRDDIKARVSDYQLEGATPVFEFQPARYFRYVVSNQLAQIGARFKDGASVIDMLATSNGGVRPVPGLQEAQSSNHLGVTAIIVTKDGYLFMYVRSNTDQTDPGVTGFAASTAMPFSFGMRPETFLASSEGFKREIDLEAPEFLPSTNSPGINLLYLGALREWARAGKPEMYFLARSKLTLAEHQEKLRMKGNDRGKVYHGAIRTESDFFRLLDPLNPARSQRSIFFLLERSAELALQEAAKGGLYLLYNAYESAQHGDNTLVEYLGQVPSAQT